MKFTSVLATASLLGPSLVRSAPSNAASVNPFAGHHFFESPTFATKITKAANQFSNEGKPALAKKAREVAKVSTFIWVADFAGIPQISKYTKVARNTQRNTGQKQIVQFVIYNLPDRDCSAKASTGEIDLANGGEEKYKQFIDQVVAQLKQVPDVDVVLQLETDAIGNMVSNLAVEKCGNAAPAQKRSLAYAIAKLQLPNVSIYIDGAHAGWLGWPDNLGPTATVMTEILDAAKAINPAAKVRGVATNVSNFNGLGNQEQAGRDELKYINDLAPLLQAKGFDAHFIVDQGRSGNQTAPRDGGDWCNFSSAGFGPRPTTNTGSPLVDAIVWVKPGGESDGTSDTASVRYDASCGSVTSLKPAPEAGEWFQAYFEQLIVRANPTF